MMYPLKIVVLTTFLGIGLCLEDLKFPPGFKFGVATSAYQVEGGWNEDGRGISVWDVMSHVDPPEEFLGFTIESGDVACDSYHLWRRDIEMLTELGVDFYRISLSWSRILPNGTVNNINQAGIDYYNNLIDSLLAKGIEPHVTIYHWDLPMPLFHLGGWANPAIVDWLADFARIAFTHFGDRVKIWYTINEALSFCQFSYSWFSATPHLIFVPDDVGSLLCSRHVLLAHATVWRMYDQEFRPKFKGQLSIANHFLWYEGESRKKEQNATDLVELALQYTNGIFCHPIYSKEGGWPPAIEKHVAENSVKLGYPRTRLPPFTQEEKEFIKGTSDFFAFNFYMSRLVVDEKPAQGEFFPIRGSAELGIKLRVKPSWMESSNSENVIYPEGFRRMLRWVKNEYGDMKIMITENGYPATEDDLNDLKRINYIKDYLTAIVRAIKDDGVNVIGYTFWSLMDNVDNYEWIMGYSFKYGLYKVDFNDPLRTRTARQSAHYYANIIKNRAIVEPTEVITIEDKSTNYIWYGIVIVLVIIIVGQCIYICVNRRREKEVYVTHRPLLDTEIELFSKEMIDM